MINLEKVQKSSVSNLEKVQKSGVLNLEKVQKTRILFSKICKIDYLCIKIEV